MKKTIFVFGNPLVKEDKLALDLAKDLSKKFPGLEFRELDPNEDWGKLGKEFLVLDVVKGIKKCELIEDIDCIELKGNLSMHEFDLGFQLKLLKKMKLIDRVKIFGVPLGMNKEKALKELKELIRAVISS